MSIPGSKESNSTRHCDFAALARTVSGTFALGSHSIHGPSHWRRVDRNGLWLAERSGGDLFVVRLFAWFQIFKGQVICWKFSRDRLSVGGICPLESLQVQAFGEAKERQKNGGQENLIPLSPFLCPHSFVPFPLS